MGLPGGKKTKTGAWATGADVLEELAAQGHELPRAHPRLAPALQAEIDLYRRAAGLRSTRDRPRPHLLRAGRDHDRPAVLVRAEPAEHPGPHRGGPQDPHRLRRRAGHEADLGRLQPDRAAPARPYRRHPAAEAGLRRRHRHPRDDRVARCSACRSRACRREVRRRAKAINFGIIYGISAFGLANQLGIAARGGRRLHQAAISSASPASATIWTRPRRMSASNGYVTTIFGRKLPLSRRSRPRTRPSAPSSSAPRSTRRSRARPPTSSAAP